MDSINNRRIRWTVLYFLVIALLSLAPFRVKKFLETRGFLHYIGHFGAFVVCGVLVLADTAAPRARLLRLAVVLTFCAALEALEAVLYHNPFEWKDLIVDYLAVGFSPFALYACQALLRRLGVFQTTQN